MQISVVSRFGQSWATWTASRAQRCHTDVYWTWLNYILTTSILHQTQICRDLPEFNRPSFVVQTWCHQFRLKLMESSHNSFLAPWKGPVLSCVCSQPLKYSFYCPCVFQCVTQSDLAVSFIVSPLMQPARYLELVRGIPFTPIPGQRASLQHSRSGSRRKNPTILMEWSFQRVLISGCQIHLPPSHWHRP